MSTDKVKNRIVSFFLYSLHFLLKCVNETDAFKLRIEKDSVVRYDTIHISPTIGREDGTFGFGFFEYDPDIDLFIQKATQEIERVKNGTGLSFPKIQVDKMLFAIRHYLGSLFPK